MRYNGRMFTTVDITMISQCISIPDMVETNRFFLQKEGVNRIALRHKNRDTIVLKIPKTGVIIEEPPYHAGSAGMGVTSNFTKK